MAEVLAPLLGLVEQVPNELVTISGMEYIAYTASVSVIRQALVTWQSGTRRTFYHVDYGLGQFNPVTVIRHALAKCPDQLPAPGTAELSFIQDKEFRESLRLTVGRQTRHCPTVNERRPPC